MAGHSHSANIRFRKDRVDSVRAKIFSKMARMITVAAKLGGGDPDANARLRLALDKARLANMPKDNIERAIKKGTGEGDTGSYEEILYEGYGPHGVAVMLEILTDNRKRTAPEIRKVFDKAGGKLGATGSVAYMFERKGQFLVDPEAEVDEEQLLEIVLSAGGEDLIHSGGVYEIRCEPADFSKVQAALEAAAVPLVRGEVAQIPGTLVQIDDVDAGRKVQRLLDALDDHEDVQAVYANPEYSDAVAEAIASEG